MEDDIILIASNGVIIRIQASSIRECARPSKGVRVMRLNDDAKVVTLARTTHEEESDGTEEEEPSEPDAARERDAAPSPEN